MSDPIDDLLAQIKSSDDNSSDPTVKPKQPSPMLSQPPAGSPSSIDDLLAEMEERPTPPRNVQPVPLPPPPQKSAAAQPAAAPQRDVAVDNLLAEMKSTYQQQEQAENLKQQQQLQAEQHRQATLKRQRQTVIAKQAEEWLKTLDPRNGEGAWFEEFAAKYPSRVEAAIEYLGLEG